MRRTAKSILAGACLALVPLVVSCRTKPAPEAAIDRATILRMFARAYYPGRSGQVMIAPREGRILTSTDPNYPYMHGSPWDYDTRIPLIFYGAPFVRPGRYADVVSQQAVAPTIARLLKLPMPVTTTGPVLDRALAPDAPAPRMVLVAVLDGARSDYLERHAASLPNLSRLRREGAEFDGARVDYLPTATAVAHATVATGTDPRVHGIVVNLGFDTITGQERDPFRPDEVPPIMVPTLADLWNIHTGGRAVIAAQGSLYYAPAALAGHGACMSNARPVIMAAYSQTTGGWVTNPDCFRLPAYLASMSAKSVWESAGGVWLGHDIRSFSEVRRTAIFARFEIDALTALIEHEPFGADDVADLMLVNLKTPDFVGHKYGPDSPELAETMAELDRQIGRALAAVEAKVGKGRYLVVITADHGMPGEPPQGGRILGPELVNLIHQRFDPGEQRLVQLYEPSNGQIFVDRVRLSELGVSLKDVAAFLEQQPFMYVAFTEDEVRAQASAALQAR